MRLHPLVALTAMAALLTPAAAAAQNPVMVDRTAEQLHNTAAGNATALMAVAIADARAAGISARDWGFSVGERFAESWGPENNARSLARGLVTNFRSVVPGLMVQAGELSDDVAIVRFPADFPALLNDPDEWWGLTRMQYRDALEGISDGIARRYGYRAVLESGPDAVVLTIRR